MEKMKINKKRLRLAHLKNKGRLSLDYITSSSTTVEVDRQHDWSNSKTSKLDGSSGLVVMGGD